MHQPYIYKNVRLPEFRVHIAHLAEVPDNNESLKIRLDDVDAQFTLSKSVYKVKSPSLCLLIRTSDIGRDRIHELYNWLTSETYQIKVRRSPKKKYINQIKVEWTIDDGDYQDSVISMLEKISFRMNAVWPPTLSIGYYSYEMGHKKLPGKLVVDSVLWRIGHKLGAVIGKLHAKFKNAY